MNCITSAVTFPTLRSSSSTKHHDSNWKIFISQLMRGRYGFEFHAMIFSTTFFGISNSFPPTSYTRPVSCEIIRMINSVNQLFYSRLIVNVTHSLFECDIACDCIFFLFHKLIFQHLGLRNARFADINGCILIINVFF